MDPPLETPRLRMRPFTEDDVDALHAVFEHPDVAAWIDVSTREDATVMIAKHVAHQVAHGYGQWAAEDGATGRLVGEVGLQVLEGGPDVEIGWVIARDRWGEGLAAEAAAPWLDVAWDHLGLDEVLAVIRPENAASRRVAEKLGMREEGTRHAYGRAMALYAISRPRRAGA